MDEPAQVEADEPALDANEAVLVVQELDELVVGVADGGDDGVLNRWRGEQLTRDVAGEIRAEERYGIRDVLRLARPLGHELRICASTSTFW